MYHFISIYKFCQSNPHAIKVPKNLNGGVERAFPPFLSSGWNHGYGAYKGFLIMSLSGS